MNSILRVFASGRMLAVLFLGFASGLPLYLTGNGSTIQAWMSDAHVDLATIGRFSLIGLPYALKFLWAPILDAFPPPFLGRRRGWALLTQLGLAASLALMAFTDPAQGIGIFALAALAVAFFSASQDIVLDAFRTEILRDDELGAGGSVYQTGYRLAMLTSGAVALALSAHLAWRVIYLGLAALVSVGVVTVLVIPEPRVSAPLVAHGTLSQRVFVPFADFFKRAGAMEILAFTMLYKLPTLMATALTTVFLLGLGFDRVEIAAVAKVAGLIATIVGTLAGGAVMVRLGIKAALWVFGFAQALGGGLFILLAVLGKSHAAMVGVIIADNFLMGMGSAAIVGFIMSVCSRKFTGTQFALLSSLPAFTRVILIAPAGSIAKALGWPGFFVFSMALAVPGLLLLTRYDRWTRIDEGEVAHQSLGVLDIFVMAAFMGSLVVISTEFVWPKIGLPDIGLYVGGAGLLLAVAGWVIKEVTKGTAKPGRLG